MNTPALPRKALVDADFLAYRVGFASQGEEEALSKARLTEWLNDLLFTKLDVDDYKLYLTGKGNFRDEVAVTQKYKGNRDGFVRPEHYAALRQLMIDKYDATLSEGQEADDDVAIESCRGEYILVHTDKDLDQLQGHHYNPIKGEFYYVSEFEGLHSFYTQMLTGDRVDNVPGLAGIGKVKAAKILATCKTESDLLQATMKAYKDKNHNYEYYLEQGQLLWLRRYVGETWKPKLDWE